MKYFHFFIAVILIFHSCGSSKPRIVEPNLMIFSEKTEPGLVVGTITFLNERARFGNYYVEIDNLSSNEAEAKRNSTYITLTPSAVFKVRHYGEMDNGLTYFIVLKRFKGNYTFENINCTGVGYMTTFSSAYNGFSIPFEVESGKITYIGNLIIDEYSGNGQYGIAHQNNFEKDITEFQKIYPNVIVKPESIIQVNP